MSSGPRGASWIAAVAVHLAAIVALTRLPVRRVDPPEALVEVTTRDPAPVPHEEAPRSSAAPVEVAATASGRAEGARERARTRLAEKKLPGGQDPGTNVSVFRIPVAEGESKESTRVNVLDPSPKLRVTEVPISKDVKIPIVSFELDLFSTNADPANLGAKPRRVVHARAIETQVM